ncbi:unnamed protein product [Caenorhabditis auriculariae]|uniref:K Homology domain-containing protein n=1 Tax=Caenorhabditis auriculariae TaxID=2777116 RepID=A0A8S1GY75_9PELO|nr:unnamed protein product [Caenorhabditis auriculariae]
MFGGGDRNVVTPDSMIYLEELMQELRILTNSLSTSENGYRHAHMLLTLEIQRVWQCLKALDERNCAELRTKSPAKQDRFTMVEKISLCQEDGGSRKNNIIGRIIGPRGISVKQLETETGCTISIHGKGSIKDAKKAEKLARKPGWEHLREELHVRITAVDIDKDRCDRKLRRAKERVEEIINGGDMGLKQRQFEQLAIISGTYRCSF